MRTPNAFSFRPSVETLADRTMPSVSLVAGDLVITGRDDPPGNALVGTATPSANDRVFVSRYSGPVMAGLRAVDVYRVSDNGVITDFPVSQVTGEVIFNGRGGNDLFENTSGLWTVANGGTGNDTLIGSSGDDVLEGGLGQDYLYGAGGDDELYANIRGRVVVQDGGYNYLDGGTGSDKLTGAIGADDLFGGAGQDRLYGEGGADRLFGGTEDDRLSGGAGEDMLSGEGGADDLVGGTESDRLFGNSGGDKLFGDEGADYLDGGTEDDGLAGGTEGDTLLGGAGADKLYGEGGADSLDGGTENDMLFGGVGPERDTLRGGTGADRLLVHVGLTDPQPDVTADRTAADAQITFRDSPAITGKRFAGQEGTYSFQAGAWTDNDVIRVDEPLGNLQQQTGNTKLLKTAAGQDMSFLAVGQQNETSGFRAGGWNGGTEIAFVNLPAIETDWLRRTVYHEIGHNWDTSEENRHVADFRDVSGWEERDNTPAGFTASTGVNDRWQYRTDAADTFARDYGRTNPQEDMATTWEAYFVYTFHGGDVGLKGNDLTDSDDLIRNDAKWDTLNALFADLRAAG